MGHGPTWNLDENSPQPEVGSSPGARRDAGGTHEHITQYQHFNELFYQLVEISDTLCQAHIRLQRERNFNGDAEARLGKWKRNLISDAWQTNLQLAENLEGFLRRMHSVSETLDFAERQRIVRLLVKEMLLVRTKLSLDIQFGFPNRLVAAVKFRQTPAKSASKVKITFRGRGMLSQRFDDFRHPKNFQSVIPLIV